MRYGFERRMKSVNHWCFSAFLQIQVQLDPDVPSARSGKKVFISQMHFTECKQSSNHLHRINMAASFHATIIAVLALSGEETYNIN